MTMGIKQVMKLHQKQLAAVIQAKGVKQMYALYEQARADLDRKLGSLRGKNDSFTAQHLRAVLAQVRDAINLLTPQLRMSLNTASGFAQTLATRHLIASVKALEKRYTGHTPVLQVEQAGVLAGIYKGTTPSLLNRHKVSGKTYGPQTILAVRHELAKSLLTSESVDQAVDRVVGTDGIFEKQRWRAERIVRTELSHSYGVTKQAAMEVMAKTDVPDLKKKLVATIDNRTGEDSKELNGQVQRVDQPFIWKVRDSKGNLTGKVVKYMQPPNRPQDREIVIPWRDGWT